MRRLLAAVAACVLACDGTSESSGRDQPSAEAYWRERGATLVAQAVRDTVSRGDSVVLLVEIRNGAEPRVVRNDVELLEFSVVGPDGGVIAPKRDAYQEWNLGPRPNVHLPRGGVTGMAVNLTCLTQPYAPAAQAGGCMRSYDFSTPGQYEITVRYAEIRVDVPGAPPAARLQLQAEPVVVLIR